MRSPGTRLQGTPAKQLAVFTGLLLLSACGSSPPVETPPPGSEPSLVVRGEIPEQALDTIVTHFSVMPGQVDVRKSVLSGDTLLVLLTLETDQEEAMISGVLTWDGTWHVDWMNQDLWRGLRAEAGSGKLPLFRMAPSGSSTVAFGGFIDPDVTRLVTVRPSGTAFDADTPNDGATIVLAEHGMQVRVYAGEEIAFAYPLVEDSTDAIQEGDLGADARDAAEWFVTYLATGDLERAGDYVASLINPQLLLPPLHDIITSPPAAPLDSTPGASGSFVFRMVEESGRVGLLELWLTPESGGGKVVTYNYFGPVGVILIESGVNLG